MTIPSRLDSCSPIELVFASSGTKSSNESLIIMVMVVVTVWRLAGGPQHIPSVVKFSIQLADQDKGGE